LIVQRQLVLSVQSLFLSHQFIYVTQYRCVFVFARHGLSFFRVHPRASFRQTCPLDALIPDKERLLAGVQHRWTLGRRVAYPSRLLQGISLGALSSAISAFLSFCSYASDLAYSYANASTGSYVDARTAGTVAPNAAPTSANPIDPITHPGVNKIDSDGFVCFRIP
jgi:hypothetical protein